MTEKSRGGDQRLSESGTVEADVLAPGKSLLSYQPNGGHYGHLVDLVGVVSRYH